MAIFQTNALPLGSSSDGVDRGLFLVASRLNHSCQPNVETRWNAGLGGATVHATSDIAAGDELAYSYVAYDTLFSPRAQRRALLAQGWGFQCGCAACALEGDRARQSDARRRALRPMSDAIYESISSVRLEEGVGLVEQMLALLDEEGLALPNLRGARAYDAFQGCKHPSKHADVSAHTEARAWLQCAYVAHRIAEGEDGEAVVKHAAQLQRPLTAPHRP
ncbi:hypothetical protein FOA52_009152 [Chlamydomonas sp. UWO 241]|nr:hypothetical protein FOA52_009152 [Chlamydomonas sp. UWO 241]